MKEITYEELLEANKQLHTVDVKGKGYVEVHQRVKAFRMVYPQGRIITDLLSNIDGVAIMKATVMNEDGDILATGTAYEKESNGYINKTSYIENLETSCVGRALGFAGFGIDASIASAEEVDIAIQEQEKNADKPKYENQKTVIDEQGREKRVVLCTISQMETINDLFKEFPDKLENILKKKNLNSLREMTKKDAEDLIIRINTKKEETK